MAANSNIEWTDASWNPVRGCKVVSPGCTNCYAMKQAHRFSGKGKAYEGLTKMSKGGPVWTGAARTVPELLDAPLHWKKPRRIFVNSMSDLFHEDVPFQFIADVFAVMACTTRHIYQVLTKRPQRVLEWFRWLELGTFKFPTQVDPLKVWPQWTPARGGRGGYDNCGPAWPLENVWLGVSVEDQARADERIPLLLQTPAAVRWISAEPLLGPVDLRRIPFVDGDQRHKQDALTGEALMYGTGINGNPDIVVRTEPILKKLHWIVVGGESGPGARPCSLDWIRSLIEQCRTAGVPIFVKQLGAHGTFAKRRLKNRKGGDPAEWPEDLRVREYPA
jgi:protein gp37